MSQMIEAASGPPSQAGHGPSGAINRSSPMSNPSSALADEATTIETVTFRLKDGVTLDAFLDVSDRLGQEVVSRIPGFMDRSTSVDDAGNWLIVIRWQSMRMAEAAL